MSVGSTRNNNITTQKGISIGEATRRTTVIAEGENRARTSANSGSHPAATF